jgi:hypothetical protein
MEDGDWVLRINKAVPKRTSMDNLQSDNKNSLQLEEDAPPPFLKSWNRIYTAISIYTFALILILYLITLKFNS